MGNLGRGCAHLLFGSILNLRGVCIHHVFFLNIFFAHCIQLVILPNVESKLLMKFRKNGIIHLSSLLEGAIINQPHLLNILLVEGFLFGQKYPIKINCLVTLQESRTRTSLSFHGPHGPSSGLHYGRCPFWCSCPSSLQLQSN
ncbi:hypothetical protein AAZX31_13G065000 [Glycine max]